MDFRIVNLGFWKDDSIKHFKKCFKDAGIKFKMDRNSNMYIDPAQKKLANKVRKDNNLFLSI